MSCPIDYRLCDQTVTVYRLQAGKVARTVVEQAYYRWQVEQVTDELGSRQETLFSLILPGDHKLLPGDRIYAGIGPEISAQQWGNFLPVAVSGLSQIQYVKPCYWQGEVCHIEAGRK